MSKLKKGKKNALVCLLAYVFVTVLFIGAIAFEEASASPTTHQRNSEAKHLHNIDKLMKCYVFSYRAGILDDGFRSYEKMLQAYSKKYTETLRLSKIKSEWFLAGYSAALAERLDGVLNSTEFREVVRGTAANLYDAYKKNCDGIVKSKGLQSI